MQRSFKSAARYCALFAVSLSLVTSVHAQKASGGVTLEEDASAYTLANGIITARIDKHSGDLLSMKYKGDEMLATIKGPDGLPDVVIDKPGTNKRGGPSPANRFIDHQYGFWSHDTDGPNGNASKVTIDPKSNGGVRAEVDIKGLSKGQPMGAGPGGNFISDIEIRYALGAGDSGIYTYSVMEHQADYPASVLGEARFCVKLNDVFDWMTVGPKFNAVYPKAAPGAHEDKYDFTANQFDNPAFGWSSTTKHVGVWFLNPSVEYLSGGPTKVEFLGHRDTNEFQAPTILNYWRSSHYGGAAVDVDHGEHWDKVIGPFMIYVNQGATADEMYKDALAHAHAESAKWPYNWVEGVDYPHKDGRADVSGKIVLTDPQAKGAKMTKLRVGLTYPGYTAHPVKKDGSALPDKNIDWQTDAKHYEFWAYADANGNFKLTGVRPGNYTLHAIADGVLGEYAKTDITVAGGKALSLGTLDWTPKRYGRQIWEIGTPNRTGSEFAGGDDYAHDGMFLRYAERFPNDVNYIIGKSDPKKDWYLEQVPHNEDPSVKAVAYNMKTPMGRATPWTITFNLDKAPGSGKVHLRMGCASTNSKRLDVFVNDQPVTGLANLTGDDAIARNGLMGIWSEQDVVFDASTLKAGTNVIKLVVPAGPLTAGMMYDYLRLEIE